MSQKQIKFVFFGTSKVSAGTLEVLKTHGFIPSLIVCGEDKPKGRGLALSQPAAKIWGDTNNVRVIQPMSLKEESVKGTLTKEQADLFVVTDYDKMIPKEIFDLPPHKTLNIHYSRLPRWRGASPIHSTILYDNEAWVTIMEIVEKFDRGRIIGTKKLDVPYWPMPFEALRELMIKDGALLLVKIMPDWIEGKIKPSLQDEARATYAKKIIKEDGLLNISDSAETNLRKVLAYSTWPGAYMYYTNKHGKEIRLIVKEAEIKDGKFTPTRVIPAGKREMTWQAFLLGN